MKKVKILMLLFVALFLLSTKISAAPQKIKVEGPENNANPYTFNEGGTQIGDDNFHPAIVIQNSEAGRLICLSGLDKNRPANYCRLKSGISANDAYGVGYILHLLNPDNEDNPDLATSYWMETLVLGYLGNHERFDYDSLNSSSDTILNTGKTYSEILNEAREYANKAGEYSGKNPPIDSRERSLTFTLEDDGYYYSNAITVGSDLETYTISDIDNSKYEFLEDQSKFRIKESDVVSSGYESFTASLNIDLNLYKAAWYECQNYHTDIDNSDDYYNGVLQDVALAKYEIESSNAKIILKGDVSIGKVIISKKSATDSKELPGATLQILNSNKEVMACKIINSEGKEEELEDCKWVSGDKPVDVVGLSEGKYFLKEILAPDGYAINESMLEFEVKYGETRQIEMVDELEVDVPNTLSTRSAMIIAIAMFDIALGIGLINYVKKTKTAK